MLSEMSKGGPFSDEWFVRVIRDEEAEEWEKDVCQLTIAFGDDSITMHNLTFDELDQMGNDIHETVAKMRYSPDQKQGQNAKDNQK